MSSSIFDHGTPSVQFLSPHMMRQPPITSGGRYAPSRLNFQHALTPPLPPFALPQAWDVLLSLYTFSPLEGVRLVGYARVPADSIIRTDGHPDAAAPVAALWYDARPAFKPLHETLPAGTVGLDMSDGASASGWFSGSGISPGAPCARILAQVRITQKLPPPPARAGEPAVTGSGVGAWSTESELQAVASSLVRRPKADPATEGDGADSEDQAAPSLRSIVQKVGLRLAPLPLPLHGILAASPLYSAAIEAAKVQHGAGGGVEKLSPRTPAVADVSSSPQKDSGERSLLIVIYQVCGWWEAEGRNVQSTAWSPLHRREVYLSHRTSFVKRMGSMSGKEVRDPIRPRHRRLRLRPPIPCP